MDSKNPSGAKGRAEVYDWIQCIIFALVFCVLLFVFAVRMVNVVGHSMVPTLEQNDKVVISNLFYHPKQGDIVVLRKQTLMEEPIVKRICEVTDLPVDVHLMIEDPDRWAPEYAKLGAASISFHMGATHAPVRLARQLRDMGCGSLSSCLCLGCVL